MRRTLTAAITASALAAAGLAAQSGFASTPAPQAEVAIAHDAGAIAGSYIVTLRTSATTAVVDELVKVTGGLLGHVYTAGLQGYSIKGISEAQVKLLAANPLVKRIESDRRQQAQSTQSVPNDWALDRIDQRNRPLNSQYSYGPDGSGVTIYGIDSGILTSHSEFAPGRASVGADTVGDGKNGIDCNGHGTHTASVAAGNTYGVAKKARLVAVRVLDCGASGDTSDIIAGIQWVQMHAMKPAIANISINSVAGTSTAEDQAVRDLVASGVTTVIAAGNGLLSLYGDSACNYSPSRVQEALVVSAVRMADDQVPSWANFGTCVDLFAPGEQIPGAWIKDKDGNPSTTASQLSTGTSEAAPMAAGAAAMYLSANTDASVSQVMNALTSNATSGAISKQGNGSPDKLLYTGFMGTSGGSIPTPNPTPTPTPTPTQTSGPTGCTGGYGHCRPYLQVATGGGAANLLAFVDDPAHLAGKTVFFFVRSGSTGQVRSLGAAKVDNKGYALRYLGNLRVGQAMRIYCKINDAPTISNPRSNDVDFHVKA